ncbi:STAS/SEC14 domain-containing protein [Marinimicrobium sp. ABcell2]|uniref:STAS/SEC14 domain-containing protein n=1 Tax=Marinimicrobium sp. ABcell2 TaxID=3069751 RepID=UPI0027B41D5A|nr:STAS/SEC14 domain-containing protein [Marinimicrobium sp. ABcell2]MDQ2078228.1 STAS/SEC14 domain-containing protein [Marinimicrobium sp. ABcell2]
MLHVDLDKTLAVATLRPDGPLSDADFEYAANIIDQHIEARGPLRGVVINTRHFPGWDSWRALKTHFRFVRDHHKIVARVALVTDSPLGKLGETFADHFTAAKIRHFPFDDLKTAREWVNQD